MQIRYVDIQNFKKLKACRIEFSNEKTIFVGANNSGKTSAMDALKKFLYQGNRKNFSTTDFTLSNWVDINRIGEQWEKASENTKELSLTINDWEEFLPSLDVWLKVEEDEIHHITHILPSLDWYGGNVGVRIRFEPKDLANLYKDYIAARKSVQEVTYLRETQKSEKSSNFELSPKDMRGFLEENLLKYFVIRSYTLDPQKLDTETTQPQTLGSEIEPFTGNPLNGLIRIDYISAQRGFADPDYKSSSDSEEGKLSSHGAQSLSLQLRAYYNNHLNPEKLPDASDIGALEAIHKAQREFDEKLKTDFRESIQELESLGYPGFSSPKITLSTQVKPMNSLDHKSAVQYDLIDNKSGDNSVPMKLPESHNGLGYQNLISMVFKLMSFRDDWMQVGKVSKQTTINQDNYIIPPLHLVFIEEPEAHLHAQVQQVFIRKAYDVLRSHDTLGSSSKFKTQMVVSTHSSHIAHETDFSSLRYFRRNIRPSSPVPTSSVVNLSNVFGDQTETKRFVTRYIKSVHCELLFADAVILVEGPAERMLLPQFIESDFSNLFSSYISILEIGGSHAHRLKALIEALGIHCLIITDLDCIEPRSGKAVFPEKNKNYITDNYTLKNWLPKIEKIDSLLDLDSPKKCIDDKNQSIRVAYQTPIKGVGEAKALATTFEDALAFENLDLFQGLEGNGLIKKFAEAIEYVGLDSISKPELLSEQFFNSLRGNPKKAEFALDLIYSKQFLDIKTPTYIYEGLQWLEQKVSNRTENTMQYKDREVLA